MSLAPLVSDRMPCDNDPLVQIQLLVGPNGSRVILREENWGPAFSSFPTRLGTIAVIVVACYREELRWLQAHN